MIRGGSLAVRLALLLAAVLVVVLLVAGIAVNRAVSRGLETTLTPRQQERLSLAAGFVEEGMRRGIDPRGLGAMIDRIANSIDGVVRIVDGAGRTVVSGGRLPAVTETELISAPLSADVGGGALEIEVPSPGAIFLRAFNTTLLVTGVVAVGALLLAAAVAASRLTRPLRDLAGVARRLGAGDLAARASGGPDAESAELAQAFNAMAERLERSEILRRRAASDLAHDLATPATVLESQLQAMVDGVVPADATQLERARAAASGLSAVISQLGELTQAEAAPLQRRPETVDLARLARDIVATLDALLGERQVTATISDEPAPAVADPGQLARALRNVITNAVQHTPPGAEVTISAAPGVIRVTDRGPGIAQEDAPYVFERFYRADRSRGRPGSGVGLTVARDLVAANGGSIEIESTGPGGTTFRITLPLAA